jgi:nitrite reductase (NADH) large subunit
VTRRITPASIAPSTIVVVGNGMVGSRLVQLVVESSAHPRRIVVFGEEPTPAYDRIRLSDFLAGGDPDELTLLPRAWYEQHGVELFTGEPVVAIDRRARRVSSGTRTIDYDELVLATGAAAIRPDVPGVDLPGVMVYRTRADLLTLRQAMAKARRVLVVGGGLLGLEVAGQIAAAGLPVTVVEAAGHLMPRQLDAASAQLLQRLLEQHGVHALLDRRLCAISRADDVLTVRLADGDERSADLVVLAIGVRANDQLARECGLEVAPRGGVVVDAQLRTSDAHVSAIGDCAAHGGVVHGMVGPGYEMARVLVDRLNGGSASLGAVDRSCRFATAGIEVAAVGAHDAAGRELVAHVEGGRRSVILQGRRLVGARAVGTWARLREVEEAILRGRKIDTRDAQRFQAEGELWPPGQAESAASLAGDALVCHCARVTRAQVALAVVGGASTPAALGVCTRAGTVCGSCVPTLVQLCGLPGLPVVRPRATGMLAALSAIALVACLGVFALGPIPYAKSAHDANRWFSDLWRMPLAKQITGFSLLGVAAAGLLLSLRKRVRWFRLGAYPIHRAVHAGLGLACLAILVAHTGLHLGHNLNRALMLVFLGVAATGGAVGLMVSGEATTRVRVVLQARPILTWLHLLTLWVLPVLVIFHVLSVYYL